MAAVYNMYKLQFQTQFHCYTYDSIWNNLQKQQYVHSSNSLLYFLQTMLILYVHVCAVEYLCVACELSNNGQ